MRVFLSWSGDSSRRIAEEFHSWLPRVIQRIDPYVSSRNIEKGVRWSLNLANELDRANFGIVCLTSANIEAPWVQFEAGALSKSLNHGKVVPVLFGVNENKLAESPLLQFQNTKFDRQEIKLLMATINSLLEESALKDEILHDAFEKMWPDLDSKIGAILSEETSKIHPAVDANTTAYAELQSLSRESLRRLATIEDRLSVLVSPEKAGLSQIDVSKLADNFYDFVDRISLFVKIWPALHDGEHTEESKAAIVALANLCTALKTIGDGHCSKETMKKAVLELRKALASINHLLI